MVCKMLANKLLGVVGMFLMANYYAAVNGRCWKPCPLLGASGETNATSCTIPTLHGKRARGFVLSWVGGWLSLNSMKSYNTSTTWAAAIISGLVATTLLLKVCIKENILEMIKIYSWYFFKLFFNDILLVSGIPSKARNFLFEVVANRTHKHLHCPVCMLQGHRCND